MSEDQLFEKLDHLWMEYICAGMGDFDPTLCALFLELDSLDPVSVDRLAEISTQLDLLLEAIS